jgi:hypothetical protein
VAPSLSIFSRPTRARKTRGDVFTNRLPSKFDLLHQLVDIDVKS